MKAGNPDIKERLQNSINFIESNLDNTVKLEDLAKIACYSPYHYHRVFKQAVGQTPVDYLRKRRLARSAQELACTDERIVDIALKYQFSSQESFTRAFTHEYGISPAKFRKSRKLLFLLQRKNILKDTGRYGRINTSCLLKSA
jgi:AraC family transcriptional regulator